MGRFPSVRLLSLAALCLTALLVLRPAYGQQHLVVNTGHNPPLATDGHTGFHDLMAIEAYRRAGISLSIVRLPSQRSSLNANKGIEAGNGPRIANFDKHFPNLRVIPEKAIDFDFVGFSLNPEVTAKTWADLDPYTVGLVTGWKILEVNVAKTKAKVVKVSTPNLLFGLLANGRADVVLIERWQGLYAARAVGLKNLRVLNPPFASLPMYFYLHKDYAHLTEKVAKALRDMKADGTYQRLYEQTLLPLTNILR